MITILGWTPLPPVNANLDSTDSGSHLTAPLNFEYLQHTQNSDSEPISL